MNKKIKETEYELGNMKAKAITDMGRAISIRVCVAILGACLDKT